MTSYLIRKSAFFPFDCIRCLSISAPHQWRWNRAYIRKIAIVKVRIAKTLRSETCKFSAVFVALGLEPPVLVFVPLAGDVLLVVVILLVVDGPLVAVLLLEVVVVWPALGVPRMPPWAVAGTLWPFTLEAADLNKSSVSEPLMLRRELVSTSNTLWVLIYLRRINHTNHTSLTMSNLATIEPYRICIIDSQRPYRLKCQKVIGSETMFMITFPSFADAINPLKKLVSLLGWHGLLKAAWATEWSPG
jgi:hypothetical protein